MHTSIEDRSKRNKIETQDEIPRNSLSTDCHSRHLDALSYLLPNIRFSFCIPLVHLTSVRGFRRKPKPILKQTETFSRVTVHLPVRTLAPEGRFKNLRLNPRHYNFRLRVLCAEAGEQLEKDVKVPPTRSQNNRCVFMTWIISLFCGTTLQEPAPIGRPSPPPRQWQGK